MKHFILLWVLSFATISFGQNFDNTTIIKKSKRKSLLATANEVSDGKEHEYTVDYWEFNDEGQIVLKIDYEKSGKVATKYTATYKEGKIKESIEVKNKINEIEKTIYEYNQADNLVKKSEYRNDKLVIYYQYYYTGNQLDSIIWYDKKNNPQLFEYHEYEDGKLTTIIEKNSYGRLDGKTEILYHENGELKEEKLFDGFGEMYEHLNYNDKGLITERKIVQGEKTITYTFDYSGKGLLKSGTRAVSDGNKHISYDYKWSKKTQQPTE